MYCPLPRFDISGRSFTSFLVAAALTLYSRGQDYSAPYYFSTLAGVPSIGHTDGAGTIARFNLPSGMAVDAAANVYVTDKENHTIRKITPAGLVSTVAGAAGKAGGTDGTGIDARFNRPESIAVDGAGILYVADTQNHLIRKITPAGTVTTLAGLAGSSGSSDGASSAARFNNPAGIAVDAAGNVYVADRGNQLVRKITPAGIVTTLAGAAGVSGNVDGLAGAARFTLPTAVAVDGTGNLYVCDSANNNIRKITPGGAVTTFAGVVGRPGNIFGSFGSTDGEGTVARFEQPSGVALDQAGNLYVSDRNNKTIRKISPAAVVTTLAGLPGYRGGNDGTGSGALFYLPTGIAADGAGNVYVADTYNQTIRKILPSAQVTTLAGYSEFLSHAFADGTGSSVRFSTLRGITIGPDGNLYVADTGNNVIRRITPGGVVSTYAGAPLVSGSTDGTSARFAGPSGISADTAGNLFVTESANQTIRKVSTNGSVSTIAGSVGVRGGVDGSGGAAQFGIPLGIAVDAAGMIYVADTYNDAIRKVTPAGDVTTLAGALVSTQGPEGEASRDGTGRDARLRLPWGVATDKAGNIFVAEQAGDLIRKITPAGVVTTVAGAVYAEGSTDGLAGNARFTGPEGLAVDAAGNIYVADTLNCTIRKITPTGIVTSLGGSPGVAGNADGLGREAIFDYPVGIAVDASGTIFVATDSTVMVGRTPILPAITTQPQSLTISSGGNATFSVLATGLPGPTYQWYFNGNAFNGATSSSLSFSNVRSTDAGDYTVVATNALGSVTSIKATLTVTAATSTTNGSSASSSGGGGGAPSAWFVLALLGLAVARAAEIRRTSYQA